MDMTTRYMGLTLAHPFVPGASPMSQDLDSIRRLEDAGAPALVLHSLFEEQVRGEEPADASPAAHEPEEYLEHVTRVREAVSIPLIASINGVTPGGWLWYGTLLEQAGAHALELNVYEVNTDPEESGADVEQRLLETVQTLSHKVRIPIAVKLSPYYSSLSHLAAGLEAHGAAGLVLFNRFMQPDIDPDELEVRRTIHASDPRELLLRLRWLAILSGRVGTSLACTGGVHSATDAVKAILAGADVVQVVSCLLTKGPGHLRNLVLDLRRWLDRREVQSLADIRGSLDLTRAQDPKAYERANYLEGIRTWATGFVPH